MDQSDHCYLTVRIPRDLKLAFDEACSRNDRTASQLVRDFVRTYVAEKAQLDLLRSVSPKRKKS